jgi:hypothetical protein
MNWMKPALSTVSFEGEMLEVHFLQILPESTKRALSQSPAGIV